LLKKKILLNLMRLLEMRIQLELRMNLNLRIIQKTRLQNQTPELIHQMTIQMKLILAEGC